MFVDDFARATTTARISASPPLSPRAVHVSASPLAAPLPPPAPRVISSPLTSRFDQAPQSAVSFSEYVASEFVTDEDNPSFRLAFVAEGQTNNAAQASGASQQQAQTDDATDAGDVGDAMTTGNSGGDPVASVKVAAAAAVISHAGQGEGEAADSSPHSQAPPPEPTTSLPPHSPRLPLPTLSSRAQTNDPPMTRSDSLPNLTPSLSARPKADSSRISDVDDAQGENNDSSPHIAPQGPALDEQREGRSHWGKLDCLELDDVGKITERSMTRAEIMQEARSAGPNPASSPAMLALLSQAPHASATTDFHTLSDMLASSSLPADSRRAVYKTLRDYLRNSLQIRDIRQVDPAFVAKPALWVRHSAIVVSLESLRAIILFNKMFLFDPAREETRQLVMLARKCVLTNPEGDNPQPFEFNALEGILIFVAVRLEKEFGSFKPEIDKYLHQLPKELTTKMLEELRRKKQQLSHFHSRANNVKTILENLLEDDEEMADMYLTEKHNTLNAVRDAQDHGEAETLLETYLQVIEELVNHASLLDDAIDDTEGLVMIHLDTLRNRLLTVELSLSVVTMMSTLGSVISGVFGMNFSISLFHDDASLAWFWLVVAIIVAMIVIFSWSILMVLRRRGLYGVD